MLQATEAAFTLDPKIDLLTVLIGSGKELVQAEITPEKVSAAVQREGTAFGRELIRRLPAVKQGAFKWIDNLTSGGVPIKLDTSELSTQVRELRTALSRVAVSLLVGGLLVGTAIVAVGAALFTSQTTAGADGANANTLSTNTAVAIAALVAFVIIAIASLFVIRSAWRTLR